MPMALVKNEEGLYDWVCDQCKRIFTEIPERTYEYTAKIGKKKIEESDICEECYNIWLERRC